MNPSVSLSDTGAILGKTFLKIGLVTLFILLLASGFMAYLAAGGFFTGWDHEFDSQLASIAHGQNPDKVLLYLFAILGAKALVALAFLFWLNKKI